MDTHTSKETDVKRQRVDEDTICPYSELKDIPEATEPNMKRRRVEENTACVDGQSNDLPEEPSSNVDGQREDTIRFYSKSKHRPVGAPDSNEVATHDYSALNAHTDFRKVLSNFHVAPFSYEGKTYRTIEHAFQAAKIALVSPELAHCFTVESGNEIGLGDGRVAQKNRKIAKLSPEQLTEWGKQYMRVMRAAAEAKYAQCKEAREILLLTYPAQLWHIQMRKPAIRFKHLEDIRETYLNPL